MYYGNYFTEQKIIRYFNFLQFSEFDERGVIVIKKEFRAMNKGEIDKFIQICKKLIDRNYFFPFFYIEFNNNFEKIRKCFFNNNNNFIAANEYAYKIDIPNAVIDVVNVELNIERGFVPLIKSNS